MTTTKPTKVELTPEETKAVEASWAAHKLRDLPERPRLRLEGMIPPERLEELRNMSDEELSKVLAQSPETVS